MTEPMTLTVLAGLLVVIAVGPYLYRTIVKLSRGGAPAHADEPDSGTPAVAHVIHHQERCESRNPQRGADHYRGLDGKTASSATPRLFGSRGSGGTALRANGRRARAGSSAPTSGGARSQKTLYQTYPQGNAPGAPDNLRLAVRAVHLHTASQWPGGLYCAKDQSPFPCRLRRWGEGVLLSAGWSADDIAELGRAPDAANPPFR